MSNSDSSGNYDGDDEDNNADGNYNYQPSRRTHQERGHEGTLDNNNTTATTSSTPIASPKKRRKQRHTETRPDAPPAYTPSPPLAQDASLNPGLRSIARATHTTTTEQLATAESRATSRPAARGVGTEYDVEALASLWIRPVDIQTFADVVAAVRDGAGRGRGRGHGFHSEALAYGEEQKTGDLGRRRRGAAELPGARMQSVEEMRGSSSLLGAFDGTEVGGGGGGRARKRKAREEVEEEDSNNDDDDDCDVDSDVDEAEEEGRDEDVEMEV